MSQLFRPGINNIARISAVVGVLVAVILLAVVFVVAFSPYTYNPVGVVVEQPVNFSHRLHAERLNIDCRYCHGAAEVSAYAGIPDTHTCMSCHSQIATYSELLAPVRASYENDTPLVWNKVHDLAAHVYFNHSVHVNNGIGCESCHGRVDQMLLVWQDEIQTMQWCLDCHRAPEQYVRPQSEIYTFGYEPEGDQIEEGLKLVEAYQIHTEGLTNCRVCHR